MSFKRMLSLVLVLCMVLSFFPASAFADNDVVEEVVEEVAEAPAEAPAEEPAAEPSAEEPAEEPSAEEPAEEPAAEPSEDVVEEEVVEEAQTVSEEAMLATGAVYVVSAKVYKDNLADAIELATNGDTIMVNADLDAAHSEATIDKNGLTIEASDNSIAGDLTITGEDVVLSGFNSTGLVLVNAPGLTISDGTFVKVKAGAATSGNITGGKFTSLDTSLIAEGYALDTDGTVRKAIAVIGDKTYPSLRSAIEAAKAGDTITLIADDEVSFSDAAPKLEIDKALTIDGDGFEVVGLGADSADYNEILVKGSGNVTFTDIALTSFGEYVIYAAGSYTGTLTLDGVTITDFDRTAVVAGGGKFVIDSCIFTGSGPAAGDFQSGVEVINGKGTIANTMITGMGSADGKWDAGCVQAGHPLVATTGELVIGNGNTFEGKCVIIVADGSGEPHYSPVATSGTVSVIEGSDSSFKGAIFKEGPGGTIAIAGGTFDQAVPEAFCAEGFIPVEISEGVYGVKEGTYVVRVMKRSEPALTGGQGYEAADVDAAVAAAIEGYVASPTDLSGTALVVLSGDQTGTMEKGKSMYVYLVDGSFTPKTVEDAYISTVPDTALGTDGKITAKGQDILVTSDPYVAMIVGADGEPIYYKSEDWATAVSKAKTDTRLVLTPLVDGLAFSLTDNETVVITKNEHTVNVLKRPEAKYELFHTEKDGTIIWSCKNAVASVTWQEGVDPYYQPVYKTEKFTSFSEAAAFAEGTKTVTLIATPTDASGKEISETYEVGKDDPNEVLFVKFGNFDWLTVKAYGDYALNVEEDTPEVGTTKFSVVASVAYVTQGTGSSAKTTYFSDFQAAINFVKSTNRATSANLPIVLLTDITGTYKLDGGFYTFVKKDGHNVDIATVDGYAIQQKDPVAGVTEYFAAPAVASITVDDETTYYATFAEAVDDAWASGDLLPERVVKVLATPTDHPYAPKEAGKFLVDLNGIIEEAAISNLVDIDPALHMALGDPEKQGETSTYLVPVEAAVASITVDSTTTYYNDFDEAMKNAVGTSSSNCNTIVLLANIEKSSTLGEGRFVKVQKGDFKVDITNDGAYVVKQGEPVDGVTLYSTVAAVAAITVEDKTTYYDSFAKAVEDAWASEELLAERVVVVLATPTDTYKAEEVGSFLVATPSDISIRNYVQGDVENGLFVQDPVKQEDDTWLVSVESAGARIDFQDETFEYYDTFQDAAETVLNNYDIPEHPYKNLVITPLKDAEWTIDQTWQGKAFRVANSENSVEIKASGAIVAVPTVTQTFTVYSIQAAEASIKEWDDGKYDKYGQLITYTKYFATLDEAAEAADDTRIVTALKDNLTYVFDSAAGITVLKIDKTGKAITVSSSVEGKGVETDGSKTEYTVYTLTGAVASITDEDVTTYYATFDEAAAVATNTDLVVVLMANVEDDFTLPATEVLNVQKGDFSLNVVPGHDGDTKYAVAETTKDGVTNYKSVEAVASFDIGTTANPNVKYFATFADAAAYAFVPADQNIDPEKAPAVTLLKAPTEEDIFEAEAGYFNFTSTVENYGADKIIDQNLSMLAGLAASAEELGSNVWTITIDSAAASITDDDDTTYYATFAEAAAVATNTDLVVVLMANVEDDFTLPATEVLNVQKGDFSLNVVPGHAGDTKYAVAETTEDGVTNYKSVEAIASITAEGKTTYYATFAEAVDVAFVPANSSSTLTVEMIKAPTDPKDVYAADKGSVLIKTTFDVLSHIEPAEGLAVSTAEVATGTYKITVDSAVASITLNNGKVEYFASVEQAVASGHNTIVNPIVLLAEVPAYAMATVTDLHHLYVNKNGQDFTVTTTDPHDVQYAYEIKDKTYGDVTEYWTVPGVAYLDFITVEPAPESGTIEVHNYSFYGDFADAVAASDNGEYVIVLVAAIDNPYTITRADQVIKVQGVDTHKLVVKPAEGLTVTETKDKEKPEVTVYTASLAIATVEAKFGKDSKVTTRTYGEGELATAVYDALNNREGVITLAADPDEGFSYTLSLEDTLTVKAGVGKFTAENFTVPDGYYVSEKKETGITKYSAAEKAFSVADGDEIKYFATFTDAVAEAQDLETYKVHGDVHNPEAVITLWKDMTDQFSLSAVVATNTDVQSLFIKAQGNETKFVAADSAYFVVAEETAEEGVNRYALTEVVATVTTAGVEPVPYASFAEAAEDAFNNNKKTVTLQKQPADDDIFQMPIGTLNVDKVTGKGVLLNKLAGKNIVAYGEDVSIVTDPVKVEDATLSCVFSVVGNEAAIQFPGESDLRRYATFEDAYEAAKNRNLVIIPLTSLDKDLTGVATPTDVFYVADSEYEVSFRATDLDFAVEGVDPAKYTVNKAVVYVNSDEIVDYDDKYNPIYRPVYFANFEDAIAYADSVKVIYVIADNQTYAMAMEDTFWVDTETFTSKHLNLTAPEGLTVGKVEDTEKNATWCYVGNNTVILKGNGGETEDGEVEFVVDSFKVGAWLVLDDYNDIFTRRGYVFDRWTHDQDGIEPVLPTETMPDHSLDVFAQWATATDVTILWANDGVVMTSTTQKAGEVFQVLGLKQLPEVPTKEGYRLDENNLWYPEVPEIVPEASGDIIYNLNWIKQYTVNFFVDGSVIKTISVDAGSKLSDNPEVPEPEEPGMAYKWTLKGSDYDMDADVTTDLTLTGTLVPAGGPVEAFVQRGYSLMLGREASAEEVQFYADQLKAEELTGAQMVSNFMNSPEFAVIASKLSSEEIVGIIYETMLDRVPSEEEAAYHAANLEKGYSYNAVINCFSQSPEFLGICEEAGIEAGTAAEMWRDKNILVTAFVKRNYSLTLVRDAAGEELDYYCERLLQKYETPQQVATHFVFSPECVGRGLSDEQFITMLYNLYMDRDPDADGLAYYIGLLASGVSREQIDANFGASPEFAEIVKSYGL